MPPVPIALSPSRLDLHRDGHVVVHYRAAVSGAQRFTFAIPHRHATAALRHLAVRDSRGPHPTVTLPGPPSCVPCEHDAHALPQWLRRHIGRHVEVQLVDQFERDPVWSVSGELLGARRSRRHVPRPARRRHRYTDDDAHITDLYTDTGGPDEHGWIIFVRHGRSVVARGLDSLSHLIVRTPAPKTAAGDDDPSRDAVASVLPDAVGDAATLHATVCTHGSGRGELEVSYCTGRFAVPLYDFAYELDASPVLDAVTEHPRVRAEARCSVRLANPLPFALRDARVCLVDAPLRHNFALGFDYARRRGGSGSPAHSPPGSPRLSPQRHHHGYSRSRHGAARRMRAMHDDDGSGSDVDLGGSMDLRDEADDDDDFVYKTIALNAAVEESYEPLPPYKHLLQKPVSLQPDELHVAHVGNTAVELSREELLFDTQTSATSVVCVRNVTDTPVEAGTWSVWTGESMPVEHCEQAVMRPGKFAPLPLSQPSPVDMQIAVTGRRGGEQVVGMRGWSLQTLVQRHRVVTVDVYNTVSERRDILFTTRYQTDVFLRGEESAKLFRHDGVGTADANGEPLECVAEQPRGYLLYSFTLQPGERATVVARQTYSSRSEHDVRDGLQTAVLARLERGGTDEGVVELARATGRTRLAVSDARERVGVLRQQVRSMRNRLSVAGVDFSDDEDGEAADRYEEEVARMHSRLGRLRDMVSRAETRVTMAQQAFDDAVEQLREVVWPGSGSAPEEV